LARVGAAISGETQWVSVSDTLAADGLGNKQKTLHLNCLIDGGDYMWIGGGRKTFCDIHNNKSSETGSLRVPEKS